ncbi:signal peptide protein [Streptomyces griseorubiginosus]|uniref:signal peptide protein n=1 Tax=Streptomyces griseorubiginosus TaxID=67304 RepID=UPI002E7FC25A|nr:signal peptide protein [Streptomyces griseorubiginosus]WUB45630.1 signal peptide protein [Streptomyces griseorubiginosus]WUB54148.1 signal peptide protein [Streptomyces griseorubiginosus]
MNSIRLKVALVAGAVALAGLAVAGPAAAATPARAAAAVQDQQPAVPVDFVDLAATPLVADGAPHDVTVTYRNDTPSDRTVAPQLLVESPDAGPFLTPEDLVVEQRTAHGCWRPVPTASQTGTLFTDLTTAQRTLHPGEKLTQVYRITVVDADAQGTVQPRIALY